MSTHILVVEDNPDSSQLVSWILEDEGYNVTCVDTGEDCLFLLENTSVDLILMDISLPGISGKETTRHIRCMPRASTIPVLALTAQEIKAERQSIMDSGVNDILNKPVNEALLIPAIQKHLKPKT